MPDGLDSSTPSNDTTSSSTETAPDTASASATAQAATPDTSAPAASTSSASATADAATPSDGGQPGSLTAGNEAKSTQAIEAVDPKEYANLKKQLAGSTRSWQQERAEKAKLLQELETLRKQMEPYQGIDPQTVNTFRQSQEKDPWDPESPKHAQFRALAEKRDLWKEWRAGLQGEELQRLDERFLRSVGEEGLAMLNKHEAWSRQEEKERLLNPQAYYRKLVQREAQPVIQQSLRDVSSTYAETQKVQQWLKENQEVSTVENLQKIEQFMSSGMPFEVAAKIVERDHYKSLVSTAEANKKSAEEKQRILENAAGSTIARNPSASSKVDFQKVAKERGITDSRGLMDLLFELDAAGKL